MKVSLTMAAALLAALAATAGGMQTAKAQPCGGPFRQCADAVGATCSRDADGKQRMTYWDTPGNVMSFEQCVGRIFEANGQANPYTTAGAARARQGKAALTIPYTELLYPQIDP